MSHPNSYTTKVLRSALKHIAGKSCSNYTSGPGSCIRNGGRKRNSPYGATRWCDACIAYDALQKAKQEGR